MRSLADAREPHRTTTEPFSPSRDPSLPLQIVLDDVTEYDYSATDASEPPRRTKLESILLSGTQVTMLVPGSSPEDAAAAAAGGGGIGAAAASR